MTKRAFASPRLSHVRSARGCRSGARTNERARRAERDTLPSGCGTTATGAAAGTPHSSHFAGGFEVFRLTNGIAPLPPIIWGSSPFHLSRALYCTYSGVIDAATVLLK